MGALTELLVRNPMGVALGTLESAATIIDYTRTVNNVGNLVISVPWGAMPDDWLVEDTILEYWRQPTGGAQYLEGDTIFLIHQADKIYQSSGEKIIQITAPDANEIINHHVIPYDNGTSYASKGGSTAPITADDMAKAYVRENMGSLAVDTARDMTPWVIVQANSSAAPLLQKDAGAKNLLNTLQEIANSSYQLGTYLAFDLVSTIPNSGVQLEFRTYINYRGLDHRWNPTSPSFGSAVLLSVEGGAITAAQRGIDFRSQVSAAYAAGQNPGGKGTRPFVLATDPNTVATSPWSRHEGIVNTASTSDATTLYHEALAYLFSNRVKKTFTAAYHDTDQVQYGKEFRFGDYVTCSIDNELIDCRLNVVNIHYENKAETITPTFQADA